ncbi:MAG TPA: prepilin-type N-terminal cleavage/methylation domain-containing protein [bacterium]|nr:prepilin-type N-terminal cleavage/methylation domain-containing protein [bacterium]HOL48277.1 prepilin-type N-terminal cleavage/methylation domain-containing protein [bacterium]HPQ18742.1 prepilin-type N-terminal cleavage/methylation domain-containing protein [bacterium]
MKKNEKGFTLIELLVVITIIGILASTAIPKLMSAIDRARETKCRTIIESIKSALQMYSMDSSSASYVNGTSLATLAPQYIAAIPTGPYGNILYNSNGQVFSIGCYYNGKTTISGQAPPYWLVYRSNNDTLAIVSGSANPF